MDMFAPLTTAGRNLMPLRTHRRTIARVFATLAAAAAVVVAGIAPASAAPATAAKAAAIECSTRITTPVQIYTSSVYSLVEVSCNQTIAGVGGSVALYRDGTFLGSARVQYTNRSYAYKLNMVTCVPGNYHAMGYAYANFDGGAADIFDSVTTPTVAITCT
ncbi:MULTISPECIES: hypothetical protein [unclassified Solwaraspora]|uniref:hypothetical protein n=1 Tax=unclassified Solwaraspora TaxID=2627926 RepID=UPI00259B99C8|nr:hypothetical protein [Solwaraspora sp. WMMA2056]WJK42620.1 hypothetical protein O7608_09720 [Solwaraspora sp. WMMA2056]